MNPAPVVGAPGARPATCQTSACPMQGAQCCATCPNRAEALPAYPPPLPPPMPAQQPLYAPPPQPVYAPPPMYAQPPPAYYPPPSQNPLQPVMDKVNADSVSWWKKFISYGPWAVLVFLLYYYALEYFSGRWDPFKKNPNPSTVVVGGSTYTQTTTQYPNYQPLPPTNSATSLGSAVTATTTATTYDDGNYQYRVDHVARRVIVGLVALTTEARSAIAQWEMQGYTIEQYRRAGTPIQQGNAILIGQSGNLKGVLNELKVLADELRRDWVSTYASRFYGDERETLQRRIDTLNDKVNQALGLADQEAR